MRTHDAATPEEAVSHHPEPPALPRPAGLRRLAPALCLALTGAGLIGCGSNAVQPEGRPNLADLRPYLGKQVTVTAEVAALQSPRAFTIVGREGSGAEPLLVVHPPSDPVDEDRSVTVTGTVAVFDAQKNLVGEQDPARLTQFDGKAYIDATRVVELQGQ